MLVPLVNFSSSFRFRVRQSCAVSLRLSPSKPACLPAACRRLPLTANQLPAATFHCLPLAAPGGSRLAPLVLVPVLLLPCSAAECCHHICCSHSVAQCGTRWWGLQSALHCCTVRLLAQHSVESPGACSNRAQWQILTTFFTVLLCCYVYSMRGC
jgi:hypothetical protein